MRRIGLTGGIASGKSTVSRRLAELGAVIVDADLVAREVVEPGTPALAAIEREFGSGVIDPSGRLDRPALGAIVFGAADRLAALNAITHPAVRVRTEELFREAVAADPHAVVVHDIPLLVESATGRSYDLDTVIVVEAPAAVRRARLIELRGMSPEEADRRIAAQASDAERRAIADHTIDSGGELADTLRRVDELWPLLSSARADPGDSARSTAPGLSARSKDRERPGSGPHR